MGLFSGIKGAWDDFRGKTGQRAAQEAARIQADQFNQIKQAYQPLMDFGMGMLPQIGADATAQGMGDSIGSILQGQGFQQLVNERQNAATAALSQAGLRRSGAAATQAAAIPTDLAFGLEQELARRRMGNAGMGLQGLQGVTSAMQGIGQAKAGGVLGAAQARQQGIGNILGLAQQVGSAVATGGMSLPFSGMGGSPGTNPGDYMGADMRNWIGRQ